jgi:replicative DNA helicase
MNAEQIHHEPHDIAAEQAVLGAMMLSPAAADRCRQALVPDDFYRPGHGLVFAAVCAVMRDGTAPDAITVKECLETRGQLAKITGAPYLHTLIAAVPAVANADYYARAVRGHAVTRRLREAARRALQMTEATDADPHGLTEAVLREIESVRDAGMGDGLTVQTIAEFLDADESDDYDWVIEGLLERGDRLVITGMEGAGKSELFRMLAVTVAAGIHPFTFRPMPPKRVLVVDCENSARHTRRKIRPLVAQARLQGHPVSEADLWIECRPQGMDLALDRDVSWLLRQVAAISPDVTFLGPLYRLAPRALNDDSDAAPVIATLNMIRARGSAVVL